jgi:hypothetical protein
MAVLARLGDTGDICGVLNSAHNNWYHTLSRSAGNEGFDDDGLAGSRRRLRR